MKAVSKDLSIWLFTVYMVFLILILGGITFLLSACTEEMIAGSGNDRPGEKIAVNFTFGGVTNNGDEVVTHGNSGMNPETVIVPLDNDLCMEATLEAERPVNTRAATTTSLKENAVLRILAYRDGEIFEAFADYKVTKSGVLTSDNPLRVPIGDYKFVAYSCNLTVPLPAHKDYELILLGNEDLLWGCYPETGTHEVNAYSFEEVPIMMVHKFPQLKIMATTEDIGSTCLITDVLNVSIVGKSPTLIIKDGVFTVNMANSSTFYVRNDWSGKGTTTVTCYPSNVYTHDADAFKVSFSMLKISMDGIEKTFDNNQISAIFNKKLLGGVFYTVKIRFKKNEASDIVIDDLPVDATTYVGAFWKADETGERLIRIDMGANSANYGAWTAQVAWCDHRWGSVSGVVLDTDMIDNQTLANRGISFSADMDPDISGSPEYYQLTGNQTSVSGIASSSQPFIFFRVGLKSRYTPTTAYPARYAVILLSYSNNTRRQRIFLRQGEGADNVMINSDPVNTGGLSKRTKSAKFTTRNLTAQVMDAQLPLRGAIFADYPSQAGAMFQWAHPSNDPSTGRLRWAWNPSTTSAPSWQVSVTSLFWNGLKGTEEVSPLGFRRPNDGITTTYASSTDLSNSEFRQSLFVNPQTGYNLNNETTNSIWGYYADGFFDRRRIVNETTVASGTPRVAYIGRLFFNPVANSDHYYASLFFPAAGYRNNYNGNIGFAGIDGMYWSSSVNNDDGVVDGCLFGIGFNYASLRTGDKSYAFPIRAVAE
jgi:hypothetical protein